MRRRGSTALTAVAIVLAIGLALFVGGRMLADRKSRIARVGWNETLGTRDQIAQRYPSREANESALRLEAESAALGIDVAPRWAENRTRPTPEAAASYKAIRVEMSAWSTRQLERKHRGAERPPEALTGFLELREKELEAVRRRLTRDEVPRWERNLERPFSAPFPNLAGHLELHRLLVADSQVQLQAGRHRVALADLEASWRLNLALRDEPMLITQLMSIRIARMQAGALRQVTNVPSGWRERLVHQDYRDAFTTALSYEGWMWTRIDEMFAMGRQSGPWMGVVSTLAAPYVEYCVSDVSEKYRRRIANLEKVDALCDSDLAEHDADLDVPVPAWNSIGKMIVPSLGGAVDRLARLEIDLELTAALLELERTRRAAGGAWPESDPGMTRSSACPDDRWIYETAPDGSMTLALSREISWPDQRGLVLPTRFTIGP